MSNLAKAGLLAALLGVALFAVCVSCAERGGGTPGAGGDGAAGDGGPAHPDRALGHDRGAAADQGARGGDRSAHPACQDTARQTVTFQTDDGVTLEADLYPSGTAGGPAAVLLHMVPPHYDRSAYPQSFIDALQGKGLTVLNLDRRGAGNSGGVAQDAYLGPKGKLDAQAAYAFLAGLSCPVQMTRVVFIGASNGTTTALDFTIHAASTPSINTPGGLVFLTGGTYTEAQNKIDDHRALLDTIPTQFVYTTAEASWSARFQSGKAPAWAFVHYTDSTLTAANGHGSKIFTAWPPSIQDVASFAARAAGL